MKTKLFLTMTATAIILAGCSKDDNETIDNWNGEIRLSSGVTVQTRANSTDVPDKQIAGGQKVGVFIANADDAAISTNLEYNADGSGALTLNNSANQPYYPADGAGVKIIAYHPYSSSATDEYDFTVAANQATVANYYASDLLYSGESSHSRTKDALSLTFAHKLSKVVCTLIAGAGTPDIVNATVEIVTPESAVKFNRTTGALTTAASSTKTDNVTLGTHGAIVPPQTFAKGAQFLKVTLQSGGELYHTITDDAGLALDGSKVYTFNITVNLTELSVTSTITDWEAVGPKNGTAEME